MLFWSCHAPRGDVRRSDTGRGGFGRSGVLPPFSGFPLGSRHNIHPTAGLRARFCGGYPHRASVLEATSSLTFPLPAVSRNTGRRSLDWWPTRDGPLDQGSPGLAKPRWPDRLLPRNRIKRRTGSLRETSVRSGLHTPHLTDRSTGPIQQGSCLQIWYHHRVAGLAGDLER